MSIIAEKAKSIGKQKYVIKKDPANRQGLQRIATIMKKISVSLFAFIPV